MDTNISKIEKNSDGEDRTLTTNISTSETVTPGKYSVKIDPEDWVQNATIYECEIVCPGIYKNGICYAYPDEEKMKKNCHSKTMIYKLINDIFEKQILEIQTDTYKLRCKFIGDRPTETIYLDLEQLPFPDCPGSKSGL